MAKTKTMVLVFGHAVSLFLPASKEKVVLVSGKSGFGFWFQFCLREGVGVFLPPLISQRYSIAVSRDMGPLSLAGAKRLVGITEGGGVEFA